MKTTRFKRISRFFQSEESGAIVVEGTIALAIFMFFMFSIFTYFKAVRAQAKMQQAMMTVAKDVSQMYYLYDMLGLSQISYDHSSVYTDTDEAITNVDEGLSSLSSGLGIEGFNLLAEGAYGIYDLTATGDLQDNLKHLIGNEIMNTAEVLALNGLAYMSFGQTMQGEYLQGQAYMDYLSVEELNLLGSDASKDNLKLHATFKVKLLDFFDQDLKIDLAAAAHSNPWWGR